MIDENFVKQLEEIGRKNRPFIEAMNKITAQIEDARDKIDAAVDAKVAEGKLPEIYADEWKYHLKAVAFEAIERESKIPASLQSGE